MVLFLYPLERLLLLLVTTFDSIKNTIKEIKAMVDTANPEDTEKISAYDTNLRLFFSIASLSQNRAEKRNLQRLELQKIHNEYKKLMKSLSAGDKHYNPKKFQKITFIKSINTQSQVNKHRGALDKPRAACTECDRPSDFCQHHKNPSSSPSTSKNSKRATRYQPYPSSNLDNQPKILHRSKKNDRTATKLNNNEPKKDEEVIVIDSSSDEEDSYTTPQPKQYEEVIIIDSSSEKEDSHANSRKVFVTQTVKPEPCAAAPIAEPTATEQVITKKSRVTRNVKLLRVSVKPKTEPVSSCASLDINQDPSAAKSKRKASIARRAKAEPYAAAKSSRRTSSAVDQESDVSVQEKDSSSIAAERSPKRKASALTETSDLSTTSDQVEEPLCKSRRKSPAEFPSKKRASRVATNKRTSRTISSGASIIDFNVLTPANFEFEEKKPVPEIDYLQLIKDDLSTLRIKKDELTVSNKILGEGQIGTVYEGMYGQTRVACKTICLEIGEEYFYFQMYKELVFSRKLSECQGVIRYFGWTFDDDNDKFYLIQPLIDNGDARKYLSQKGTFYPEEVLVAGICLFSALRDAHAADVGIVDLKLENFLIDSSGSGFLTDLGSCIEFYGGDSVNLHDEGVQWTRPVAAPEMIRKREFSKASDVFMGTLMLAESMTFELSDMEFRNEVLHRKANGAVCFSTEKINARYSSYFDLLSKGLQNEASSRPTAEEMLSELVALKDGGLTARA
ncbi:kinase-like domain-containing protein [Thamnidium elegans]|nr:kinase-like domain-containing protein [Thamnidium elegans]